MVLNVPQGHGRYELMSDDPAVRLPMTDADDDTPAPAVAGRIDASPSGLDEAIDAWLTYLVSRGKKAGSLAAMRQVVRRAARECGWDSVTDLTFESITAWLARHRRSWVGTTYNRNLSVFRSLTKYLTASKRLEENPLVLADRAEESGADGARSATTQEARALIRAAWVREQADGRCKGARALYWLCLFAHGCRPNEPDQWRRRHLVLDHAIPHVFWESAIQKSHRQQYVALAPELAPLLRQHLATIDREREAAGLPPAGPDDPVFPVLPTKSVFNQDRRRAAIPDTDYRRRPFARRSGRKWFSTTLTSLGVPEKMVDHLMRHRGRAEARYYDPPLEEQAAALSRLPRLWPEAGGGDGGYPHPPVDNQPPSHQNLTGEVSLADDGDRPSDDSRTAPQRGYAPGPDPTSSDGQSHVAGQGCGAQARSFGVGGPEARRKKRAGLKPGFLSPEIAIPDPKAAA